MEKALVVVVHDDGVVDDSTFELATTARSLVGNSGHVGALLAGSNVAALAGQVAPWFDEVHVWDNVALTVPEGPQLTAVYSPVVEREAPDVLLAAHTNVTMDFVPGMAIGLGRPLITDCLSLTFDDGRLSAIRPAYGGKANVRVVAAISGKGYLVTMRPGAVRPTSAPELTAVVKSEAYEIADAAARRRFVRTIHADSAEVDISQAERLVAVGRGIGDEEGLAIIRSLADALGAEIACSRPVVDKQWLPKSRQVGTSGKSVRPSVYVAVGISGSFQHMGGIKGDPFLVAINKDPRAPIFSVADVGIVGDLFEIVPALEARIRALKA